MIRQAASINIFRNLLVVFLICFLIFALLNTGLSFIYRPLFYFLISVPTFTMLALFAFIMTVIIRQNCVETVPSNTVGLITSSNGELKTLAPAGQTWVWFGRERLSTFLSLEPVSVHVPLLGLKSSEGIELPPLVTIINWRIHSTFASLLSSWNRRQVMEVALESQQKRERRVRDKVAEVLGWHVAQETMEKLEEYLPQILYNHFGEEVLREINDDLTPIGLNVDRLECIGSISVPIKASGAVKTLGAVHKKLESLLRPKTADAAIGDVQERVDKLLDHTRQAVQRMSATGRAIDDYVQSVITVLQQASQHFKTQEDTKAAGIAHKALSDRLMELAAEINGLLEVAQEIKDANERAKHIPSNLTDAEIDTLFKVLEAIEQKKVSLGSLFP